MESVSSVNILLVKQAFNQHGAVYTQTLNSDGRFCTGIALILSGHSRYEIYSDSGVADIVEASAGDLLILPKGLRYTVQDLCGENECYEFIFVDFDGLDPDCLSGIPFLTPGSLHVLQLFEEMLEAWKNAGRSASYRCTARLYELIACLIDRHYGSYEQKARKRLEAAIRYIAENYADSTLSVESVAAATGYTSQHLRRLFHEAFHMLPREYIRRIRIEHAMELLGIGLPIGEIAERCGFANAGYFSHVFRVTTGMLPSTYIISKI